MNTIEQAAEDKYPFQPQYNDLVYPFEALVKIKRAAFCEGAEWQSQQEHPTPTVTDLLKSKPNLTDEQIEQMAEKEYPMSEYVAKGLQGISRLNKRAYIKGVKAILNYKP